MLLLLIAAVFLEIPTLFSIEGEKLPPVTIEKIPESIEEFIALRDKLAATPEGGASILILSLMIYSQDQELGGKCLILAVDAGTLVDGDTHNGQALTEKDKDLLARQIGENAKNKNFMNSYVQGTSPGNAYRLPQGPLVFKYSFNEYSGDPNQGRFKVFVYCSGSTSPRPIIMKRTGTGIWKAYGWQSLLVDIMPAQPAEKAD